MFYILMALSAGALIVISRAINSNLAIKIGIFKGAVINYAVGLIFAAAYWIIEMSLFNSAKVNLAILPWWAWLGGLTGVMVIVLSNYITPKISSFAQTLLVFVGQLFSGVIIDYFSSGSVSIGKIIGGALVLAGLVYNTRVDFVKDLRP